MQFEFFDDCKNSFGYRDFKGNGISDNIVAESFSWDESEKVDINAVLLYIQNKYSLLQNVYYFKYSWCTYPLNFKEKRFGLWRNTPLYEYCLEQYEKKVEQQLYCNFYGLCRVDKNNIDKVLNNINNNSFIVITNEKITLLDIEKYIKIDSKHFEINFAEIINQLCSNNSITVTYISGCDGEAIHIFRSRS